MSAVMQYGTVVQFFPGKGFGFIRPDFGPDVFFHVTAMGACQPPPQVERGQMVKFELAPVPEARDPGRDPGGAKRSSGKAGKAEEANRPQARLVELVDRLPSETLDASPEKEPAVHHPRARQKKPSWRR